MVFLTPEVPRAALSANVWPGISELKKLSRSWWVCFCSPTWKNMRKVGPFPERIRSKKLQKKSVKPPCGCDDGMFDLPILRWQMKGQIPCSCSWSQYLLSDTLKESLRQFVGGVPLAAEMIPPFRLEIFHSTTSLSFAYQIIFLINPNKTPCAKKISHGFRDI